LALRQIRLMGSFFIFGWYNRVINNTDGPEQRHYKRVHALLKLADTHSDSVLNEACQHALERTSSPGYRLIKQLLVTDTSHLKSSTPKSTEQSFLRGADYYDQ